MSWKNLTSLFALSAFMAAPALADPTLQFSSIFNAGTQNIEWQVDIVDDGSGTPLMFDLAIDATVGIETTTDGLTAGFANSLEDTDDSAGVGDLSDTNDGRNPADDTWYYLTSDSNTFASGGGVEGDVDTAVAASNQVWVASIADRFEQNPGMNPFTTTQMEGLNVDVGAGQIFAALGSGSSGSTAVVAPNLPSPAVPLLHVASTDTSVSYSGTITIDEVAYPVSGTATSIVKGDLTGNTVADGDDIDPFLSQIFGLGGLPPVLDTNARADITMNGLADGDDLDPFLSIVFGLEGAGNLSAGTAAVPEPSTLVLGGLAAVGVLVFSRRRIR